MKKRITAFILIAVMAVTCCVLATGCGREKAEEPARGDENTITILISIDYPKKSGKPTLKNIEFNVEKDSTVLQATELYANVSEIDCLVNTSTNEITSIDTVGNGDYGKHNVWMYRINDGSVKTDASATVVKDGDSLTWVYEKK